MMEGNDTPIFFICSKGRAGRTTTDRLLEEIGVSYAFVVEPREKDAYAQHLQKNGKIYVLPEDGMGLPYSREKTKEIASKNDFFVILDDDIIHFAEVRNSRAVKCSPSCLLTALEFFKKSGLALMSLEYRQYGWSQKKIISLNKACDCCVFFNTARTKNVHFDLTMKVKGDRDYCIQLALRGERFGRLNRYVVSVPHLGTNAGGLQDLYRQKEDEKYALRLLQKWGSGVCKLIRKKDGKLDCKIDFEQFYERNTRVL